MFSLYESYQLYDEVKVDVELKDDMISNQFNGYSDEVIGWISINDTTIDYPIVKSKDNKAYLNRNYLGEYSISGSIFLDYRNDLFDNDYMVLYGHNLKNGGMFSDINKYSDKDYFINHLSGELVLRETKYDIDIIGYAKVNSHDFIYDIKNYKNNNNGKIIDYIISKSVYTSKSEIGDKLLLMSTCSQSGVNDRIILLASLKKSS